jgi:Effector Associated Constant Component 1
LAGGDEEKSFYLSQEFAADVARLSGVVSRTPSAAAPEPGQRGDPVTLGAIVIAAASGGALTALVNTIGSYLTRDKRTEMEISRPDGLKIKVSSAKSNFEELEAALSRLLVAMTGD